MKKSVITAALAVLALVSCTKESREMMYSSQEAKIQSFVEGQLKSNPDMKVVYNGGSVRLVLSEGEGTELNARGKVEILYAGFDFSGGSINSSKLFATNNHDFALSSRWELSDEGIFEPLTLDLTDDNIIEGLKAGLIGVREREECYILFSGKYAFGKEKNGTIPANSPLAFRVWVAGIEN